MKKYLKIFMLSAESHLSFSFVIKSLFEYSLYFILLFFISGKISMFSGSPNGKLYFISGVYLLVILLYKYFYENALVVRYLVITDSFERILTKPINPLFKIFTEKIDIIALLSGAATLIGILAFDPSKYSLLILDGLFISFSVFIAVISLLLFTRGNVPFEKLLLILFLIGFIGTSSILGVLTITVFSILFLFISVRLWNSALTKYTSVGS
jgi:ABC-type uncharacterized transport system permease subunit